jgi:hypothetical protein
MKNITLTVDELTMHWRAPRAVDLECRGSLGDLGIEYRQIAELARAVPVAIAPAVRAGLSIAETARLIIDPGFGKYPHASPFRDELLRALKLAGEVWGDVTWESIDESHWTTLLRRRCEQLVAKNCKAVRATEITISRLVTVVGWLRDTKRIARDVAQWPREWKKDVAKHWRGVTGSERDQMPDRLRYTLEEFHRIIANADFDPRLDLLLRVSVGLRPGQVARARRSDLKLPTVDWTAPETVVTDYGTFKVHGAGKKGGCVVDLTRGQRRAVDDALTGDGYLARVEDEHQRKERTDYRLFPSGYVVGRVGMLRGKETTLALAAGVDFSRNVTSSWTRPVE